MQHEGFEKDGKIGEENLSAAIKLGVPLECLGRQGKKLTQRRTVPCGTEVPSCGPVTREEVVSGSGKVVGG